MKRRLLLRLLFVAAVGSVFTEAGANQFDTHVQKGLLYANSGDKVAAIKEFEAARTLEPKSPDVHYTLGVLYGCPKGIKSYEEAIRLDSNYWQAFYNLGVCRETAGQIPQANELYVKSLQINPKNPKLQYNVGTYYLENKKFSEALPFLKAALDQEPRHYQAALNVGHAYEGLEDTTKAIEFFNRAITVNPTLPAAYINLANTFSAGGNKPEAQRNLEKGAALAIEGNDKTMMKAALTNLEVDFPKSSYVAKLKTKLGK